jgi:hypothetical protein
MEGRYRSGNRLLYTMLLFRARGGIGVRNREVEEVMKELRRRNL